MEIKIKKISTHPHNRGDNSSNITETYRVIDSSREFEITLRSHKHGSNLAIVGQEGVLYTDRDSNTVRRQVITVGRSCGVTIDADELVEGLSVLAIKGVVLANRTGEAGEITLIVNGSESSDAQPVVRVDGQVTALQM